MTELNREDDILNNIPQEEITKKNNLGKRIYNEYYTFKGCADKIITAIK